MLKSTNRAVQTGAHCRPGGAHQEAHPRPRGDGGTGWESHSEFWKPKRRSPLQQQPGGSLPPRPSRFYATCPKFVAPTPKLHLQWSWQRRRASWPKFAKRKEAFDRGHKWKGWLAAAEGSSTFNREHRWRANDAAAQEPESLDHRDLGWQVACPDRARRWTIYVTAREGSETVGGRRR
eukprot:1745943-Rhodomonas_salina.2